MAKRKLKSPGMAPGSLVFTGTQKLDKTNITLCRFNEEEIDIDHPAVNDLLENKDGYVTWYDVRGLHEIGVIEQLGKIFHLHPLVMEDMLDVNHIAKCEEYENGIFFIIQFVEYNTTRKKLETEQVGLFLGKNYIISCQEDEKELFSAIIDRLNNKLSRIRKRGSDYLLYTILDIVIDHYFVVLDKIDEEIEHLQDKLSLLAENENSSGIYHLKREALRIRRIILPLREAIDVLKRSESSFINENTLPYLDDLSDHVFRCLDIVEGHRDMLGELHNLYMSELNIKMNNVMKVLTIISSIFIPLSFIAGIYGMNFDYMPELRWHYGYFTLLGVMAFTALSMVLYFKIKRWW
ncbi:MAG: magnesium/cobalt transporter CorA [Saprospiraceae bacterium]|nr:magnesium/cobalt transporter CorA [Saprospiraceae bacterium]